MIRQLSYLDIEATVDLTKIQGCW